MKTQKHKNALFELNYNPEEANMQKTRKTREREEKGKEQCSQTILRDQMSAPHARHTPQSQHLVSPVRNSSATLPKHKLPTACNSTCHKVDKTSKPRTRLASLTMVPLDAMGQHHKQATMQCDI